MDKLADTFTILLATEQHATFASLICTEMEASAKARGTGIAKRSPEYLVQKMLESKAIIAFDSTGQWAGFCYIETWGHGKYVANSGLIVAPAFRKSGLARNIKQEIFKLSRTKYPEAKIFGLTTGLAVMKINSDLGYEPVTYSELTDDEAFWSGCKSCVNFEILQSKERKNCLCTAMLYDPKEKAQKISEGAGSSGLDKKHRLVERWHQLKKQLNARKTSIQRPNQNHFSRIYFHFLNYSHAKQKSSTGV
jgi:hypothetical protein